MAKERVETTSNRLYESVDFSDEGQVLAYAARLCVTANELREMTEEVALRFRPPEISPHA